LIDAADHREKRELAAGCDVAKVEMSVEVRALLEELRKHVLALDTDIVAIFLSGCMLGFYVEWTCSRLSGKARVGTSREFP
jgi:hypothetical protein